MVKKTTTKNSEHLLEVDKLSVYYKNGYHQVVKAVDNVSLVVNKGEVTSLVGESGSGKTTLGRAVLSLVPHASGEVRFDGRILPSDPEVRNKHNNYEWMAKNMQMIFQDPYSSLHPSWSVLRVVSEGIVNHSEFKEAKKEFNSLKDILFWKYFFELKEAKKELKEVKKIISLKKKIFGIKDEKMKILSIYYSKVRTLKRKNKFEKILLKETKKTNQEEFERHQREIEKNNRRILLLKKKLKENLSSKYHNDLNSIKAEIRATLKGFNNRYKQKGKHDNVLKDCVERVKAIKAELEAKKVKKIEKVNAKLLKEIEVLQKNNDEKNVKALKIKQKKSFVRYEIKGIKDDYKLKFMKEEKKIFMEFSKTHPYAIAKFLIKMKKSEFSHSNFKKYIYNTCADILKSVGMDKSLLFQPVSDLSGGQRQRVAIVRSIILNPRFIVADEPISALDVSMQAQVINIINDLKDRFGLTILFIAHDLRMVRYVSDKIYVMFRGRIVEYGDVEAIFKRPIHPYTKTLLSAIPSIDQKNDSLKDKGISSFEYNVNKDLKERHAHKLISVDTKVEHFVLGNDKLIAKWDKEVEAFQQEYKIA